MLKPTLPRLRLPAPSLLSLLLLMAIGGGFTFLVSYAIFVMQLGWPLWATALPTALALLLVYRSNTRQARAARRALKRPFPDAWRQILERDVAFYEALGSPGRTRFERMVQVFLATTRITGIDTTVDDRLRLLVAASGIIPVFRFEHWAYDNLNEVLLYPASFNASYEFGKGAGGKSILGMVGTGYMKNTMLLSKQALLQGFSRKGSKQNVGVHEFVHLLDGRDGRIDGVPEAVMPPDILRAWTDLMHKEMARIRKRKSKLGAYGATNEAEFFSVASEYFFTDPARLKQHHPELFALLTRIYAKPKTYGQRG